MLRILVIEECQGDATTMQRVLDRLGCLTQTVGSGLEALSTVSVDPPDLVLLCATMAEEDGLQAVVLKDHGPITSRAFDRLAIELYGAGGGAIEARDHVQQG